MLYSYKMTDDTGFAPNPYHGILSLATCKPFIRESKKVGEYIAGFTSKKLCGDEIGQERLIYIMKITEKISFDKYFRDKRFQSKKPSSKDVISKSGDNIYKSYNGNYRQIANYHHSNMEMDEDMKSEFVLLSKEFFYLGSGAIPVDKFGVKIPKSQSRHGVKTIDDRRADDLWNYLEKNYAKNKVINNPHNFQINGNSKNCLRVT